MAGPIPQNVFTKRTDYALRTKNSVLLLLGSCVQIFMSILNNLTFTLRTQEMDNNLKLLGISDFVQSKKCQERIGINDK